MKQYKFTILQFCRSDVWHVSLSYTRQDCILFWRLKGRINFLLIQVVGRIQFPVVVELKFPFPCCLSSEVHSQLLEATGISWLMALSVQIKPYSCFESLWGSVCLIFLSFTWHTNWHRYTGHPACSFFFSPWVPISAATVGQSLLCFIIHEFMIMLFNFIYELHEGIYIFLMNYIRKASKSFHCPTFT